MFALSAVRPAKSDADRAAAAPVNARPGMKAPVGLARLRASNPQPRLGIGALDDPLERAADVTADRVLRRATPATLETGSARAGTQTAAAPESVHETLRSPGQALDPATRAYFEPRFGFDFGTVRLHTEERAANSAQQIGARAYAAGEHVVFGRGAYAPGSSAGQRLLAHELAHVVQQAQGGGALVQREPVPPDTDGGAPPVAAPPVAAAACAEVPAFNSTSQPPTTVLADNVDDFLTNYYAQIGDPYTKPSDTEDFEIDGNDTVTKVNMKVDIAISRPRWGGGRPANDQQKALILKCVDVIKDHENQHQAIAKAWYATAVCDALGKKSAVATKAINDDVCTRMATAQEDFDMQHGLLQVVHDAQGIATDVITVPALTRPNYKC